MRRPKRKPEQLGSVLSGLLSGTGLGRRIDQARVIPEWPALVGPQIAAVTEPRSITADGTLFVAVTTNAWMNELSLLEPELLRSLNGGAARSRVRRIRWQIKW
jgi:predicted nucleic acid-binding Zn ribbon protein